jgi:hypothetical protein
VEYIVGVCFEVVFEKGDCAALAGVRVSAPAPRRLGNLLQSERMRDANAHGGMGWDKTGQFPRSSAPVRWLSALKRGMRERRGGVDAQTGGVDLGVKDGGVGADTLSKPR